jgi:hypothetical protein
MVNRRFGAIAFVLVVGVSILGIRGFGFKETRQSVAADVNSKKTGAEIGKEEVALAKEALKVITRQEKEGLAVQGSNEVMIWSRRLAEATRKSGATKAEIIDAFKQYVARMDERVDIMKRLHQASTLGYMDLLNAQYEAMEAKLWLEEEEQ